MSASNQPHAAWLQAEFWERLDRIESHHQRVQSQHDSARRGLERLNPGEIEEVRQAWRHYCEVIAELDRTTAEFESLHS